MKKLTEPKTYKRYKFLRTGLKSESGEETWEIGKWKKFTRELEMCKAGFHACEEPYHAFSYVQGEVLALVECRGEHLADINKECWREMRVLKTWKWTKKDSLKLAIYSAELVLGNFEKEYPNDLRPRQAIEAAKKVLFRDTEKNRSAARSAAESAAESATESAAESAWSARSAAESATESAESARSAARSAAESAESVIWSARSAAITKICDYFMKLVKKLKPI